MYSINSTVQTFILFHITYIAYCTYVSTGLYVLTHVHMYAHICAYVDVNLEVVQMFLTGMYVRTSVVGMNVL